MISIKVDGNADRNQPCQKNDYIERGSCPFRRISWNTDGFREEVIDNNDGTNRGLRSSIDSHETKEIHGKGREDASGRAYNPGDESTYITRHGRHDSLKGQASTIDRRVGGRPTCDNDADQSSPAPRRSPLSPGSFPLLGSTPWFLTQ